VPGRARFSTLRRLEAWFWTGPLGHLLGGLIDFSVLLGRALWARRAPR
jgi:hypothetical protein